MEPGPSHTELTAADHAVRPLRSRAGSVEAGRIESLPASAVASVATSTSTQWFCGS